METNERREPVILHQVPLLPGLQAKTLIIESLPLLQLSPEHIQLLRKEGKYQAFVMMPASKAKELCDLKEVALGKHRVYVRRHYNGFQVFVSRLHEQLTAEDLKTTLSAEFGAVAEIEILLPHEGAKNRWRHCYIRFEKDEAAEKCLFSAKKILVRGQDLHVARAYTIGQNEETDKKLFVKVVGPSDDNEEVERVLNVRA
jgi:hypothetical protein